MIEKIIEYLFASGPRFFPDAKFVSNMPPPIYGVGPKILSYDPRDKSNPDPKIYQ